MGYFWPTWSSSGWPVPYIDDFLLFYDLPKDVLFTEWPWLFQADPRDCDGLKSCSASDSIFRGGIEIRFDACNSVRIVDNSDTSTVEYTFIIENHDMEGIYVFDPQKSGSDIFYYFSKGPYFYHSDSSIVYSPRYKKSEKPDMNFNWQSTWYTRIEKGQYLVRTVRLKAYAKFLPGDYIFELKYSCPNQISREQRYKPDGRYWIGTTSSNIHGFRIDLFNKKQQITNIIDEDKHPLYHGRNLTLIPLNDN
jgi:hypothetical protein